MEEQKLKQIIEDAVTKALFEHLQSVKKSEYPVTDKTNWGPISAFFTTFYNYADFNRRASRAEYWYSILTHFLLNLVFIIFAYVTSNKYGITDKTIGILFICVLYNLFAFIPLLAVMVRRLHDAGLSGSKVCYNLIPFVGSILVLEMLLRPSDSPNRFDSKANSPIDKFAIAKAEKRNISEDSIKTAENEETTNYPSPEEYAINKINDCEETPLTYAAASGNILLLKELLANPDIDPNKANKYGNTPLIKAIMENKPECVKILLNDSRVIHDKPNNFKTTPIQIAKLRNRKECVKLLQEFKN